MITFYKKWVMQRLFIKSVFPQIIPDERSNIVTNSTFPANISKQSLYK